MVDILFLSKNRKEFTQASLEALVKNTNWEFVNSLWLYDDGSEPGEWVGVPDGPPLSKAIHWRSYGTNHLGPVGVMTHFLDMSPTLLSGPAEIFVKVDNDLILCPGWLENGLAIMGYHPEIDLLGIEPHSSLERDPIVIDSCTIEGFHAAVKLTDHIGGIGFFRRRAFAGRTRPQPNERYGFTEWQWANPDIVKAWINPPMPVFLLDHLPREPWRTLSKEYEAKGWQRRQWGEYEERSSKLWDWWCK